MLQNLLYTCLIDFCIQATRNSYISGKALTCYFIMAQYVF